jgi:heme-degrading monooxygenase HmoA
MIYVLFEVMIKKEYMEDYFSIASNLKQILENCDGFVRSERFSSLVNEGKILSLSVWEDEESVKKWRNQTEHRINQEKGRNYMFERYNITVTSLIRSYSNDNRTNAPKDSNNFFD